MKPRVVIPIAAIAVALGAVLIFMRGKDNTTDSAGQKSTSNVSESNSSDTSSQKATLGLPKQSVGSDADCSLYNLSELQALWGVPMVDTDTNKVVSLSDGGELYSCDYNQTDSGLGLTVAIEYRVFKSEDAAKREIDNTRSGAKIDNTVYFVQDEQSGIGDEAFFSTPAKKVNDPKNPSELLYVRKGNVVLLLSATNLDGVGSTYRDNLLKTYRLHL